MPGIPKGGGAAAAQREHKKGLYKNAYLRIDFHGADEPPTEESPHGRRSQGPPLRQGAGLHARGVPRPGGAGRRPQGRQAGRHRGTAAARPQHRPDLREDLHQDPLLLRGRGGRPGRRDHVSGPGGLADRAQGVGQGHRPGAGPDVRRHRIPRRQPDRGGGPGPARRCAGLQRAHRRLAPDPDARRRAHDGRAQRRRRRGPGARRCGLRLPRRRPVQHGQLLPDHRRAAGPRRADRRTARVLAQRRRRRPRQEARRGHLRHDPAHRGHRGRRPGLRLRRDRRVGLDGRAQGGVGRADRSARAVRGHDGRAAGHRQAGREVPALPARLPRPGHGGRPADPRAVRADRTGGHRRGLRVGALGGLRPGGEPYAHHQGRAGRHSGMTRGCGTGPAARYRTRAQNRVRPGRPRSSGTGNCRSCMRSGRCPRSP
ncbi:hypothetical protein SBRY_60384 [Actinacidiphila bryophytorum]|uniref:Uncharacterized protein n=1 Tax=Actinacidiphila bryophytorum TaxID=1436133 RepID=A0A9W4MK84_9ACTN|nr:hypothetical protein SBRY_60384 [Actinacidiphila bryophytorum]